MRTKAQIYQTVYDWLKAESGLLVIKANQKGPRPPRPYASLNFVNPSSEMGGDDDETVDPTTGIVTTAGPRRSLASVNIFGPDANDTLAKVRDSLQRPDVIEAFSVGEIVVLDTSGINDLTEAQETIYEERGQMDMTLMFTVTQDVDMKTIDTVGLTGTLGDSEEAVNFP